MNTPNFQENSLVSYKDGIYKVLSFTPKGTNYQYKLILVAYQRDASEDEFHKFIIKPSEIIVEESLLNHFDNKTPRFSFGEGVRLRGNINCIIVFIKFKNYNYSYIVREKVSWDNKLQSGWEVEEDYLQKW